MEWELDRLLGEYIVVRAEEDGVNVIGLTRGRDTKFHHTEKLDKGEVLLAQFTENTSAIKVRGKSRILCRHGEIISGE
ncbi:MAG: trp RNA-binding attenuation protein MtrB [Clostridiaceae bacterium]|nr:trp RNA-binding attenuation protein MtrB [Bacillota bacterium]NLP07978.1 trp RNA-binding attenuation protein MtrB [Clostridiaceae bacterium]HOA55267.1 trp RNA-binding attenuation protein MtrB [Clostridiales bacterium]HPZ05602.1 trp RNA-binding attenuation protein MtrB [Clostridiales bacterium]HQD30301.1 trp RNA-binding attenuation protein MtrB [Clostridiales bacterium]